MAENHRVKVAIVGGGIAGLALAAGLIKKPHLDVHVYESVPAYQDVGAGLALHLNAIKAMALLGDEVRQAYSGKALTMGDENQEMVTEVILGQGPHHGQLVAELGRAKGRKTVSRADLLDGFLALIPKEHISFGKRLVNIAEKSSDKHVVHLSFDDGSETTADCLLGADGIHSVTRGYLLGADHPAASPKNHDGWQIYRTLVSTEEARKQINPKWTTSVPILLGPRGHINCIPLNKNTRLSAGVAVRGAVVSPASQNGDGNASSRPLDPALYADYSEEAQQIVRMVARDTSASWAAGDHDHAPTYARGRVAMLGDAAHAALPFAGNGAAQALEDAAVLDALFALVRRPDQIARALAAFDEVRRPRSQAVVDLARKFGRVYAYAEDGMHEDPERMRAFFAEMAAFTNDFDVRGQNEAALRVFKGVDGVSGMDGVRGDLGN
ncbi:FAD/NAD(P)-binding domain-containing protein [Annulohypoxylon truncatum]|uniref:FAD/NAD(P)-binding domain-containing protein n=1 Tax=Annulohypoxylon truncatum TaxID=327061 RepID=UPI002008D830|nr:FAD/NAD(P)-binding domain-containing protein [Annulohypoxylon truncatum]KAI1214790.1 FAD/NAD(P)-binding domain-containing protein [Annulohypoxylon truncatum]